MRESRCCSRPAASRLSLSISHSHPLSSLTLLRVALFPLTASWVPHPASQLQCIARRRLVLARRRRLVPASLCNSPAHTLSTDDTISRQASYTRHLSPAPPTTTAQAHVHLRSGFSMRPPSATYQLPTSPAHHLREHRMSSTPMGLIRHARPTHPGYHHRKIGLCMHTINIET